MKTNYCIPVDVVVGILKELELGEINIDIAINYVKVYGTPTESSLLEEIGECTYIGTMINPLVGRKYRAFKGDYDGYGDTPIEALISLKDKLINNK